MSSLCFCNRWGEDDLVCLCYDSEEEADEEEEEESIDDNIDGGGMEMEGKSVSIEGPCTVPQRCSSTAIAGSSDTGNIKVGHFVNGEIVNGDFSSSNLGNDNSGYSDLMNANHENLLDYREQRNGHPGDFVNNSKSVDNPCPNSSVFATSSAATKLEEQPISVLEHDTPADFSIFLDGGSTPKKRECLSNEGMAKSDVLSSTEYEWQFQEKDGSWISYDITNNTGGLQSTTKINTTMSQDIERYRNSHLNPFPIFFRKNHHRCVLDFQSMTEHGMEDGAERPIRRVPKIPHNKKDEKKSVTRNRVFQNRAASRGMGCLLSPVGEINKYCEVDLCSTLPFYWTSMRDEALFSTVLLNTSCDEYENLLTLIKQTHPTLKVNQITRIQNLAHHQAYEKRRTTLKLQFQDVHFREEVLFHGTRPENVESICKENFNWRFFGKVNGHNLGRGVYFTNKATVAANYATRRSLVVMRQYQPGDADPLNSSACSFLDQTPRQPFFTDRSLRRDLPPSSALPPWRALRSSSALPPWRALHSSSALPSWGSLSSSNDSPLLTEGNGSPQSSGLPKSTSLPQSSAFPKSSARVIFIVQVLIGRYIRGCSNSDKPPDDKYGLPYDTTVDNVWNPTIFVKYNSEEYYPRYFVEFK